MLFDKICENPECGREFLPKSWWQKYCSVECKNTMYYLRKMKRRRGTSALDELEAELEKLQPTEAQEAEHQRRIKISGEMEEEAQKLDEEAQIKRAREVVEMVEKRQGNSAEDMWEKLGYAPGSAPAQSAAQSAEETKKEEEP